MSSLTEAKAVLRVLGWLTRSDRFVGYDTWTQVWDTLTPDWEGAPGAAADRLVDWANREVP